MVHLKNGNLDVREIFIDAPGSVTLLWLHPCKCYMNSEEERETERAASQKCNISAASPDLAQAARKCISKTLSSCWLGSPKSGFECLSFFRLNFDYRGKLGYPTGLNYRLR